MTKDTWARGTLVDLSSSKVISMAMLINPPLRRQLAAPAVYAYLLFDCFGLNEGTARAIHHYWQLGPDQISRNEQAVSTKRR